MRHDHRKHAHAVAGLDSTDSNRAMTQPTSKLDLKGAVRALFSATAWLVLLTLAGMGLLVAGVFVLAGFGWSLLAGGVICIALAVMVGKGLTRA